MIGRRKSEPGSHSLVVRLTRARVISALVIVACLFVVALPQPASAHANLLKASPSPSEELDTQPERVIIWFTEPIEAAFSSIKVLDSSGAAMTAGETEFDPTEPAAMWVPLTPLDAGTYTVVWRNVSTVDGHTVTGSYLFAFGEPLGAAPDIEVEDQPVLRSPLTPIVRWFIYIGIAVFVGGLFFEMVIVSRIARSDSGVDRFRFAQRVSARFTTIAFVAIFIVVVAQLAQLLLQTAIAFDDGSAIFNPARIADVVAQSDWGRFWSWRFTAAVIAAIALFAARNSVRLASRSHASDDIEDVPLPTETPFGIGAIALGGVYLLLIALTSHNAATPSDIRYFAIATDLIHVITATIWVGGIAYIATASLAAFRTDDSTSRAAFLQIAAGFAPLAIFATTTLVASGIVSSLMQVTIPEALDSPYGRVLGVKILLIVVLIGLAMRNNRTVAKASQPDAPNPRSLTRYVTIELAVAFAVLFVTAGLASLEPARQYAERHGIGVEDSVSHTETINGATIDMQLTPGETGVNTLTVNIRDDDGEPFAHADEVRGRVKYLDDEFGELFVPLEAQEPGRWRLDDVTISIGGAYQLDVTVVRSDSFDSHVSTRFPATSPTIASDLIRPSAQTAMTALGILITVVGVAYFLTTGIELSPIRPNLNSIHSIAAIVAVVGIGIIVNAHTIRAGLPAQDAGNPFPLTQESIESGRATYTASCATCHGDTGRGDGPAGLALNPPPADLAIHVPLHTDTELYTFISEGIPGTPMLSQSENLTPEQIWHLVNYLRGMGE